MIRKQGDSWLVLDSSGKKVLGTHDSEESAKKQLAAIEAGKAKKMEIDGTEYVFDYETNLQSIKDVDIFAIGTWRGVNSPPEGDKYEEKDLHGMVEAFQAGVLKPNLKITHGSDQEQVDIGRVSNLRVQAGKLLADFVNVPKALYELMKKGLFKARSAEVLWNLRQGDRTWPRVLKAVALLAPGQKPAVSGISEGYQFEASYCYAIADKQDGHDDRYINIITLPTKEVRSMKLEELLKKYNARDEAHLNEILDAKMAELDSATKKAEAANKKAAEYEAERKTIREQKVKNFIEGLNKEGKITPRHKDKFEAQLNALYEAGKDDQAKELEAVLSDMPNLVEFEEKSKTTKTTESTMGNPAAEVNRLAHEKVDKKEAKDYAEALTQVEREKPKLWAAYVAGKPKVEEEGSE